MPAWLIPALKAVLPHVGSIISAAKPVFTKKSVDTAGNQPALLQRQISELQSAVTQNAGNIKELAAQLQSTVAALEQAALAAEANLKRTRLLCVAAVVFSAIALCIAVFIMLNR
jgi:multidrug resistance efflux pump